MHKGMGIIWSVFMHAFAIRNDSLERVINIAHC